MAFTAAIDQETRGFDLVDEDTGRALTAEGVHLTIYEDDEVVAFAVYHAEHASTWEPEKVVAALEYAGFTPAAPLPDSEPAEFEVVPAPRSNVDPCIPDAVGLGDL